MSSKNKKQTSEATEKIIGKVSKEVKGEIFKQAYLQDKDVQDIVGDILNEAIEKKSL